MDAASDPYLPYDGGGDCIPLRELHRRGNAGGRRGCSRAEGSRALEGPGPAVPCVRIAAAVTARPSPAGWRGQWRFSTLLHIAKSGACPRAIGFQLLPVTVERLHPNVNS